MSLCDTTPAVGCIDYHLYVKYLPNFIFFFISLFIFSSLFLLCLLPLLQFSCLASFLCLLRLKCHIPSVTHRTCIESAQFRHVFVHLTIHVIVSSILLTSNDFITCDTVKDKRVMLCGNENKNTGIILASQRTWRWCRANKAGDESWQNT